MNSKILKPLTLLSAVLALAAGCAQENTKSTGEKAQEYLQLFIQKYYPYVTPNEYGIFVLEDTPGSGKPWNPDSSYTYAHSTIRTLSGTISSTTDETLSKQLGTYALGNYYGPRYQATGANISYAGVDALLTGMRMGGTRKAIIPAWLLTTSRYTTTKEYIDACSTDKHLEYTVTLYDQSGDITRTEKDSLARYVKLLYPGQQPVSFTDQDPDGSFYFVSDSSAFVGKTKIATDTTLRLNYIGRLLNGQVFDTTVERVAKDAGIYNAGRTYSPQSVTVASDYKSISMGGSTSLITGFKAGIGKMKWVGQKAVVLFTSEHGYTNSGSGQTIPAYSPLIFELELL